ncbi:MAG: XRE family transcriptional regulator [Bacteroidaceae bacterium]|nr:XRE family transcriptional regulator [Bacteroidaceae bacterium]
MIHIGQLIRQELQNQGRTVAWLTRELNCSRSNVYKIFEKPTLDTAILLQVSRLLKVDFFRYYTDELSKHVPDSE